MKKMRMKKIGALLMVMLMLVTSYIPLFPALEVKAQEKKSTKASDFFDNVADIDPVNNPATENWLTKLVATTVGIEAMNFASLTQAHFDSVTSLQISAGAFDNKNWEMPKEWANLRFLTKVDATHLSTSVKYNRTPDEFFQLPSMKILTLGVAMSNFPARVFWATGLEELHLMGKLGLVTGTPVPDELKDLKNLKILYFHNINKIILPDSLGTLINLEKIEVRTGILQLPDTLENLKKLQKLSIGGKIDGIPNSLAGCTGLKEIELNFTDKAESLPNFGTMVELENLNLKGMNSKLELPKEMGNLKKLKILNLEGTRATNISLDGIKKLPESFGGLESLEALDIESPNLKKLPESFSDLRALKSLDLHECVNLESLPENIGNLTNLIDLDLNVILPRIGSLTYLPDSFSNLTNLTILKLRNQQIRKLPENIGNLTNLTNINIAGNQLERIPESIGALSNLRDLDASRNQLVEIPRAIGKLRLGTLRLEGNKISSLPETLKDLEAGNISNKISVYLSYNSFKTIPDLTLFKDNTIGSIYLDYCQISDLGEWINPDKTEGILNKFFDNQAITLTEVSLKGNNIIGIPASWNQNQSTKKDILLSDQTNKVNAKFDSVGKKATLQNPVWKGDVTDAGLTLSKLKISNGGTYDPATRTFTWINDVKEGDVYTIKFDESDRYTANKLLRIKNYTGTIYVTVGEKENTGFKVTLKAENEDSGDITNLWPGDFSKEYNVLTGETVAFKLPNMKGHSLISTEGYGDTSGAAGGLITLNNITGPKEIIFKYKEKSYNIDVKVQKAGSGEDLSASVLDPNYKFQYTVNEEGNLNIVAPNIPGYGVKGDGAKALSNVTINQTVIFEYIPETEVVNTTSKVTIKLMDVNSNEELDASGISGFVPVREVPKKTGFQVPAPTLKGYKLASGQENVLNVIAAHTSGDSYTAHIYYEKVEYAITIKVEDKNEKDLSTLVPGLYQTYFKIGTEEKSIYAPKLEGYTLTSKDTIVLKNVTEDRTEKFVYEKQMCTVTVEAINYGVENITSLISPPYQITRSVPYGESITVPAPTLMDTSYVLQGDPVQYPRITGDRTIRFDYQGAEPVEMTTINIWLKDVADPDGEYLNGKETEKYNFVYNVPRGDAHNVDAPKKVEGYTLVSESPKVFTMGELTGANQSVTFWYEKDVPEVEKTTIKVELRDEKDNLLNNKAPDGYLTEHKVPKGKAYEVPAAVMLPNYTLETPSPKVYQAGELTEDTYTVVFKYQQKKATITVRAYEKGNHSNDLSRFNTTYVYTKEYGMGDTHHELKAPVIPDYKLDGPLERPLAVITGPREEIFEYTEVEKTTIKVELRDEKDNLLNNKAPDGYLTEHKVPKGKAYEVPAAVMLPNYTLETPSPKVYQAGELTEDTYTVVFKYQQKKATITVRAYEKGNHSNDLSRFNTTYVYTKEYGMGDTHHELKAPVIPDYKLDGPLERPLAVITGPREEIFEYTEVEKTTIKVELRDEKDNLLNNKAPDGYLTEHKVPKGKAYEVPAAVMLPNYTLETPSPKVYQAGELTEDTYTVVFKYQQKKATITVRAYEKGNHSNDLSRFNTTYVYTKEYGMGDTHHELKAPVIPDYKLDGPLERPLAVITGPREEIFEYTEVEKTTIKVELRDEKDNLLNNKAPDGYLTEHKVPKGKAYEVPAAVMLPNYTLETPSPKVYQAGELTEDTYTVVFKYQQKKATITVRAYEKGNHSNDLSRFNTTYVYTKEYGMGDTHHELKAPVIPDYKLDGPLERPLAVITGPREEIFEYTEVEKTTIKVELRDEKDNLLNNKAPDGYLTEHKVPKGKAYEVPAAVMLPNYTLETPSPKVYQAGELTEDTYTVVFKYQQKKATITVRAYEKGNHSNDLSRFNTTYVYTKEYGMGDTHHELKAPVIPDYKLDGPLERPLAVITGPREEIFEYTEVEKTTIKVELRDEKDNLLNNKAPDGYLTEHKVPKGKAYEVPAAVMLPNYTLETPSPKVYQAGELTEDTYTVVFKYQQKKATITVRAYEKGNHSNDLSRFNTTYVYTKEYGMGDTHHELKAPVIPDYKLDGPLERPLAVITGPREEIFEYTEVEKTTIKVELRDEKDNLLNNKAPDGYLTEHKVPKGKAYEVPAAVMLPNYTLETPSPKVYQAGELTEDTYTVVFKYQQKKATITVRAYEKGNHSNDLSRFNTTYVYTKEYGMGDTHHELKAPVIPDYKLDGPLERPLAVITGPREEIFEYTEVEKTTIKVELRDEKDNLLNNKAPDGYLTEHKVPKGKAYEVPAAVMLPNYTLETPSPKVYQAGELTEDTYTVVFKYQQKKATITVRAYEKGNHSNDLSRFNTTYVYTKEYGMGDTHHELKAPVIPDYKLDGPLERPLAVITGPREEIFEYTKDSKETVTITIHVKEKGKPDSDLSELVVNKDELIRTEKKGDFVRVPAPKVEGYLTGHTKFGFPFIEYPNIQEDQEITFWYSSMATITIFVEDKAGNPLPSEALIGVDLELQLEKGIEGTVPAPAIKGYTAELSEQVITPSEDMEVTFIYIKDADPEPEYATITILVEDKAGNPLPSDVLVGVDLELQLEKGTEGTVPAPVIKGYTAELSEQVITPSEDMEVTFIYIKDADPEPEYATITILVEDKAGNPLPSDVLVGVDLELQLEKGTEGTVPAPVIKGYTAELSEQVITPSEDMEVTFIYIKDADPEPEYATITILVEDKDGNLLPSDVLVGVDLKLQLEKGKPGTVPAPAIKGYTAELSEQVITPSEDMEVTFIYIKDADPEPEYATITILVEDKDGNLLPSDVLVGVDLKLQLEKGKPGTVPAPAIKGYTAELSEQVITPSEDMEVTFIYIKDADPEPEYATITILVEDKAGNPLPSDVLVGVDLELQLEKGTEGTVPAPVIKGYTAELSEQVITPSEDMEVTFIYIKDADPEPEYATITILVEDKDGNLLPSDVLVGVDLKLQLEKGKPGTVPAPAIKGYTAELSEQVITPSEDMEVTFIYTKNTTPDPEKVFVTIQVKDTENKDLSRSVSSETKLVYETAKGEYHKVNAPIIKGYQLADPTITFIEFDPITGNETVLFTYRAEGPEKVSVTIQMRDENNKDLTGLVTEGTKLVYNVNKGENHRVDAPVIQGYKVDGVGYIDYTPITQHEKAFFTYKKDDSPKNPILEISQSELTVKQGERINLKKMIVKATDSTNKDLQNKVKFSTIPAELIPGNSFKADIIGTFEVVFTLPHEAGNVTKILTITVNSKNKPKSPTLKLSIDAITMTVGESIDLSSYVQSAIDPDDGSDLKDRVTWTVGRLRSMSEKIFAPTESGTYQVTYRLESKAGGISTQSVDIEVKKEETKVDPEKEKPDPENPSETNNETQMNKQQNVGKKGVKTGDEQPLVPILILSIISTLGVCLVSKKKYL